MIISAKDAKSRLGEVLDTARAETVTITRHSKPAAKVISPARLEELERFEDHYWLELSRQGEREGSMGIEATKAYIRDVLDAES